MEWIGCVARLERWLEQRRFHYGAVVHAASLPDELGAWLDHSQPQAARETTHGDGGLDVVHLMKRLGFDPRGLV